MNESFHMANAVDLDNLFLFEKSISHKDFRIEKGDKSIAAGDGQVYVREHAVELRHAEKKLLALLIALQGKKLTINAIQQAIPDTAISKDNRKPAHVHLCNMRKRIKAQLENKIPLDDLEKITKCITLKGLYTWDPKGVEFKKQVEEKKSIRQELKIQAEKRLSKMFNNNILAYGPFVITKSPQQAFSKAVVTVDGNPVKLPPCLKAILATLIARGDNLTAPEKFAEVTPIRQNTLVQNTAVYMSLLRFNIRESLKDCVPPERIEILCSSITSGYRKAGFCDINSQKPTRAGCYCISLPS
ncbi:MAG: hypothetical protein DI626_00065 [Micavibrio aeruginosavorus]|uniref:Uncharacterized protein n=1 Tax=Micavibrio aeruginosavorus TaxID=349221 RepID=A0A2W5A3E3_9BACT|nr:MAG: hypothetical protein DI626_00065 [Micavibrio aeruginosavorus]